MSLLSGGIVRGVLLCIGGAVAGYAHLVHPSHPTDPALLFQHAAKTQSAHTLLFAGLFLLLLALRGQVAQGHSRVSALPIAALLLSTGILLSDMLHCVLEFSIFPVLMRSIPYAAVTIVEATYRSIPLSILESGGQWFLALGAFTTGFEVIRGSRVRRWTALPLCCSGALMAGALLRMGTQTVEPQFIAWIYFSLALLGFSLLFSRLTGTASREADHHAISEEEKQMVARS